MSEVIDVVGTCKWAKVFPNFHDQGSKPGDKYEYKEGTSIELYVDQDELKKISKLHPDVTPKVTDDGLMVKFRRALLNSNPKRGGWPTVKDADGNDMDGSVLIGDGSKVRVVAEAYRTKHGSAARLMGVQVLELVEAELEPEPELPF